MSNLKNLISEFLVFQGYKLINYNASATFGDTFDIYSKDSMCIRLVSDKSMESVDICNTLDENYWYDLALVKALINNESYLNYETTIEQHKIFLEEYLQSIENLFNNANYPSTKKKLEELGDKRASQILGKEDPSGIR